MLTHTIAQQLRLKIARNKKSFELERGVMAMMAIGLKTASFMISLLFDYMGNNAGLL